ncbi:hypothetical protein [Deminuibacter soli]|uniref:Lipoprotein n=1 Tax=Deminuibacter soli TaxID=2291815 RepID=A0A3E1NGA5_9BACT|nr:hypothetical protein [Deminuibacter soli]RFM26917.1 hypothetical protein DXN05_18200 [Deminuibacter soli]
MIKIIRLLQVTLLAYLFTSCNRGHVRDIDYTVGCLKMSIPDTMKLVEGKGIDSYSGCILNKRTNDTLLQLEYGKRNIIFSLQENVPAVRSIDDQALMVSQHIKMQPETDLVFSDSPQEDEDEKVFAKNYYYYDTIHSIVAKVVRPKRIGKGMSGIYMPKLKDGNSFSMYGDNLDSLNDRTVMKIAVSIRYANEYK